MKKSLFLILTILLLSIVLISCGKSIEPQNLIQGNYTIGQDIDAGHYVLTSKSKSAFFILFRDEEGLNKYLQSDRYSNGDEKRAREINAWYDAEYLDIDDSFYLNLEKEEVLMIANGEFELTPIKVSDIVNPENEPLFDNGLIEVGKDIKKGQYTIECAGDANEKAKVIIFNSLESYSSYHKSSRYSIGEESDAIKKYSTAQKYLIHGENFECYLSEGSFIIIEGGKLKFSAK